MKYNKITLPISALSLLCSPMALAENLNNSEKPNIVLILADDMGYSGVTAFGGMNLSTPAIDRLAENGVVCTNFHTNAPVSSPTRVSILTGSYQQRAGLNSIYPANNREDGLEAGKYPSLAKQLQNAGYATGIYGKWHLGLGEQFNPIHHGFDDFKGFLIGNIDLVSHRDRFNKIDWWHNTELLEEEGYGTDLINKYAVEFIRDHKSEPFFLYVTHGAIHTPILAPGDKPLRDGVNPPAYDNAQTLEDSEYQRRYRAMVKSIDDGVQMIVDELKNQGLFENTLIIFLSDNGAEKVACEKYPGANGFFNGYKNTLYEGGIRVPAIFHYPSMQHHINGNMMLSMDLMPTIMDLCGIENRQPIDGVSLLSSLTSGVSLPERDVFWANQGWIAVQSKEWKLVCHGQEEELFNMMIDPKESQNMSLMYPEKVAFLKEKASSWWRDVTKDTKLEGTESVQLIH